MPYIEQKRRLEVSWFRSDDYPSRAASAGELNFQITQLVDDWLGAQGGLRYEKINAVIGALECAKLELYRRVAAPYEDQKRHENGDVYTCNKEHNNG